MKLKSILTKIDDQLRLLQIGLIAHTGVRDTYFQDLSGVVRAAKRRVELMDVQELYPDLEWIVLHIQSTSSLKKLFYAHGIRLGLLKDELGAYILTVVLKDERDSLNHLLLGLHHDLGQLQERSEEDRVLTTYLNDSLVVLRDIRAGLQVSLSERG